LSSLSIEQELGRLTPADEQFAAIKAICAWYRDPNAPLVFKLTGPAGSGKSFLLWHLIHELNLSMSDVASGAYTGKAALVMRRKGLRNSKTIHQLNYIPVEKRGEGLIKIEKDIMELQQQLTMESDDAARTNIQKQLRGLDNDMQKAIRKGGIKTGFNKNDESAIKGAKLVILDECSMIDAETQADLESFGVKIIYVGDPHQLSPITKGESLFFKADGTPKKADFHLTEVRRQALQSPIVWWATQVREGKGWPQAGQWVNPDDPEDMFICLDSARLRTDHLIAADQVIVGMNKTKHAINAECREALGFQASVLPVAGDKLICRKNQSLKNLFNGLIGKAVRDAYDISGKTSTFMLDFKDELGVMHSGLETISTRFTHPGDDEALNAEIPFRLQMKYSHMDFGYAISCHMAQGSQYDYVMVIDDGWGGRNEIERRRWAYTAITRGVKKCVYGL